MPSAKVFYTPFTATGIILKKFPLHMVTSGNSVYTTQKHFFFLNLKAVDISGEQSGLRSTYIEVNGSGSFCLPAIRIL